MYMFFTYIIQWYAGASENGLVELVASADVTERTIRSGGYLVLLQEQDSFGKL